MFTTAVGLKGLVQHERWMPTKTMRLGALLGTLVFMSIAVNALIVVADSNVRQRSFASEDCLAITGAAARLAGYDYLLRRPTPQPFKGANAPVPSRPL